MAMKYCKYCNQDLTIDNFYKRTRKRKDGTVWEGYQTMCKTCSNNNRKEHYYSNQEHEVQRNKKRRETIREWLAEYKHSLCCTNCGDKRHYVLEFHHHTPHNKLENVADMVRKAISIAKIKEEIEKCDVLCANCHREYHYFNS